MMDRAELKLRARKRLRVAFWPSLLVCLVAIFLGDNIVSSTDFVSFTLFGFLHGSFTDDSIIHMVILFAVFQFFVAGPISVGRASFFLSSIENDDAPIRNIFFAFRTRNYFNIALGQFVATTLVLVALVVPILFGILITEGSNDVIPIIVRLALFIPGITLHYRFRLVPYILAQNPHLRPNSALGLSNDYAVNRRWEMFMLDISFAGWYIVAPLAFGVGIFLVFPYHEATMALYCRALEQFFDGKPSRPKYEELDAYNSDFIEISR